jgi:hypothetical protein
VLLHSEALGELGMLAIRSQETPGHPTASGDSQPLGCQQTGTVRTGLAA